VKITVRVGSKTYTEASYRGAVGAALADQGRRETTADQRLRATDRLMHGKDADIAGIIIRLVEVSG
jgi:hypothetical protein